MKLPMSREPKVGTKDAMLLREETAETQPDELEVYIYVPERN